VPDADVQHAPLLVRLCEPEFPLHQALSGGQDLRFVSQGGAVLASEIETWNRNGCSFIWVRLPLLSTQSEENDFWLYFGNSAPSDVPPAPSEVWDTGFRGVWHLAEDVAVGGFGATHRDSTSQGNHGQQERNGLSSHAGAAGGAQNLTRTDDRIVIPSTGLRTTGDRFTIEVRMSPESLGPDDNIFGAGNDSNSGAEKGRYWQIYWTSGARWVARLRIEGTRRDIAAGSYDFREIDWQYLAVVYDGSRMRFFVDGVQQNSITVSGQLSAMNTDFVIGNNPILARDFQGHVDEVRISHVPRSSLYLAVTSSCLDADCTSVGSVEVRSR
jgi:hypothetical protein